MLSAQKTKLWPFSLGQIESVLVLSNLFPVTQLNNEIFWPPPSPDPSKYLRTSSRNAQGTLCTHCLLWKSIVFLTISCSLPVLYNCQK